MKSLLILLITTIILVIWPLITPGFLPTHDGEFHIIRFWQFDKMLSVGQWFPRWAPDLNSGYGVPLFTFYYPFPNYIGVLFHRLGASYPDAVKFSLGLGYMVGTIACFLWLRKIFDAKSAIAGAIIFATVPYILVNIYVRGSLGEVWALVFFMTALIGLERPCHTFLIAISVASMILSHNISAVLFLPILFGYALLRSQKSLLWIIFGVGLSAFFWIPAIFEQKYVMGLSNFDYRDHFPLIPQLIFPSWGTGFSGPGWMYDEFSQQIGLTSIAMVLITFLFIWKEPRKDLKKLVLYFLVVFFLSIFFMLEISIPIWNTIWPLRYIQYPWRLLLLVIITSGFFGAYISSKMQKQILLFGICLIGLFIIWPYIHPVKYVSRDDNYYLSRREFTDGTTTVGNSFSTRWSDWKKERAKEKIEIINGSAQIFNATIKPTDYQFSVLAETASIIAINTLYYPGWIVKVDSLDALIDYKKDGIIKFLVPIGNHVARVYFAETPLRILAHFISLLSLFWIIGSAILEKVYEHRDRYHSNAQRA